jgi:hypothetical protein
MRGCGCVVLERGVLFCVMFIRVFCLTVVPVPPGKTHLHLKK